MKKIFENKKIVIGLIVLAAVLGALKVNNYKYFMKSDLTQIEKLPDMKSPRAWHKSFLLKDGRVLITNGRKSIDENNDTAEILDLKTKKYKLIKDDMKIISESPVMLDNGQIVFFQKDKTTIFDPTENKFYVKNGTIIHTDPGSLARIKPILLKNQKILILGGWTKSKKDSKYPVEMFNPNNGSFSLLKNKILIPHKYNFKKSLLDAMSYIKIDYVVLQDGRVLLILENNKSYFMPIQIFNPTTESFSILPRMNIPRYNFKATLLKNGKVLILGGLDKNGKMVKEAELFNPSDNSFSIISSMLYPRKDFEIELLKNGEVLIVGGYDKNENAVLNAEIYNPLKNIFKKYVKLNIARKDPKIFELNDDRFLVFGGYTTSFPFFTVSEIEVCSNDHCTYETSKLFDRYHYNLIKIKDDTFLFSGGGEMMDLADSFIKTLKDSYLIKFKTNKGE